MAKSSGGGKRVVNKCELVEEYELRKLLGMIKVAGNAGKEIIV